jgi:hypothetical protein
LGRLGRGTLLRRQAGERGRPRTLSTRLLSCYRTTGGHRLYIITEWDRSMTTILLPEEY